MTVPRFRERKGGTPLTMLTAYDYPWAELFDEAGVDALLVGDSLGMVVQGHPNTLPVTLEQMIYHGEMVARAARRALVIVDLPFLSYQSSIPQAIDNAGRVLKETGASAVKLEGGVHFAETIRALVRVDIPVMAHIGLTPQSVLALGGMKVARDEARLREDARAVAEAGAFGVVLELVPQQIAETITHEIPIPTIGIGAGPHCDGQVLVAQDMLGLTSGFSPRFLRKFGDLHHAASAATRAFLQAVQQGEYPEARHGFNVEEPPS